jgi:NADH-quinone oxidoreductase subunit M
LPRLSASGLVFAVATLGLPGFGNFVGEFLVLLGTFRAYPAAASVALLGLIAAAIYALALVQRAFHGPVQSNNNGPLTDLGVSETAALGLLAVISLWLGLHPQPLLDLATGPLTGLVGG